MDFNFYKKYIFLCALTLGEGITYNLTSLLEVTQNLPHDFDEQCTLLSQGDCVILLNVFYYSAYRSYMTLLFNKYMANIEDTMEYNTNLVMSKMRNPSLMFMQQNNMITFDEYNKMIENVLFYYDQYSFVTDALKYHIFDCNEQVSLLFKSVKNHTRLLFPTIHNALFDVIRLIKNVFTPKNKSTEEEFLHDKIFNNNIRFAGLLTDTLYVTSYVNMDIYMRKSFEMHYEIKKTLNALRNKFWQLIEKQRLKTYIRFYHKLLDIYNEKYDQTVLVKIILHKTPELIITYQKTEELLPHSLHHLETIIEE